MWRPAARPVKFAIVAPVTNAVVVPSGRPSRSRSQPDATRSRCAPTGEPATMPAFWSHAPASQLAASVAGVAPPITKPK